MPAVYRQTEAIPAPRQYKNRPNPRTFDDLHAESLPDVVCLVGDDPQLRDEVQTGLSSLDVRLIVFSSATEYLDFASRDNVTCVIICTRLPDLCGLELQKRHLERSNAPVIMISDHCDIPCTVKAMKAGAIDFLTKPIDARALMASVQLAFLQERKQRQRKAELAKLEERLALLTPREREVLPLVVGGLLNKQAASVLGISEVTLQIHRSQTMRKLQAESLADLVRMAIKLRIPHWRANRAAHNEEETSTMFLVRNDREGVVPRRAR